MGERPITELQYRLGKLIENRPGVLLTTDHRFGTNLRPWEGLSLDCRPNMDCADRLQAFAAEARERMGAERWAELEKEWNDDAR